MSLSEQLTPRQKDCLRGVANYLTYKEIGRQLGISPSMVEKHLRTAREKLGVDSTAEAARLFLLAEGEDNPQGGKINLHSRDVRPEGEPVPFLFAGPSRPEPEGVVLTGAADHDPPITPLQTLSLIGRVALGSIIALTLLIACAQGLELVLS